MQRTFFVVGCLVVAACAMALAVMPQLRFVPGKVKARAVRQIARWKTRTAVGTLTASRTATTCSTSC